MMKKTICLALCALLLVGLCGCSLFEVVDGPGMEYHATDAPTEPSVPAETTASGWHVATDYSAYTARDALPVANYTRLRTDPIPDLTAGDYGAIFPFAAAPLYSSTEDGYSYLNGRYYGFVTADGCIVCDPVFTSVSPLRLYDYTEGTLKNLPFWVYSRTGEVRTESYQEDNGDLYEWQEGVEYYGVASVDGSFVLPCEYRGVMGFDGGIICYRTWGSADFEIYDLTGKLCFRGQDLTFLKNTEYISIDCGKDVFVVYAVGRNYAVDKTGKLLFGPMREIGAFSEGLAPASLDGNCFGYVNLAGEWVIDPVFDSNSSFRNGYAVVERGEKSYLIDTEGNVRFTVGSGYLSDVGGGYYCYTPLNGKGERYYTADGTLVLEVASEEYWARLRGDIFYATNYTDAVGVRVVDLSTGKELELPNFTYLYDARMAEVEPTSSSLYYNGTPCFAAARWIPDENDEYGGHTVYTFFTEDLEVLESPEDLEFTTRLDWGDGRIYMLYRSSRTALWTVQLPDGTTAGTLGADDSLIAVNGWLQQTDLHSARLTDPSGKEVFCYPLYAVLED